MAKKKEERFIEGVMNYTGSKYKLLEQLLPEFDYTKPYFVDLFTGGGSVYTNVLDRYERLIANDIIKDLVGIHQSLLNSDSIIEETKSICQNLKTNQKDFIELRESYNLNPDPAKLWALMLSCNSNLIRFNQNGKFNQTWGKRSWNSSTEIKVSKFIQHIRKFSDKITFTSKNFNEVIINRDTFYYMDPPYGYIKNIDGSIGDKQISEAGYNNFYYKNDDINLYDFCHKINKLNSSFMISGVIEHGGKKTWILDKLISDGFNHKELNFNYEKINKSGSKKETKEIIIFNY